MSCFGRKRKHNVNFESNASLKNVASATEYRKDYFWTSVVFIASLNIFLNTGTSIILI